MSSVPFWWSGGGPQRYRHRGQEALAAVAWLTGWDGQRHRV